MPLLHRRSFLTGLSALAPFSRLHAAEKALVLRRTEDGRIVVDGLDGVPRARRGELFTTPVRNTLETPVSLVIRGLRSDAPQLTIPAGGTQTLAITPRDAGTFLLQPLQTGEGPAQLRAGLSAMVVADRSEMPEVDGESLIHLSEAPPTQGAAAGAILVNGRESLSLSARANARLWLRVANGTAQRIMALSLAGLPVTLMALDGQPCEPFRLEGSRLTLAPGQRAELFCDVTASSANKILISMDNFAGARLEGTLTVADGPPLRAEPRSAPTPLPDNGVPQTMDFRRAVRAEIALDSAAFSRPLATARSGSVVMLAFKNPTARFQAVHWTGHPARLLDGLDDGWKPFFLDTVLVAPGATERIALVADKPGRYPVFCQEINSLKAPLSTNFIVT